MPRSVSTVSGYFTKVYGSSFVSSILLRILGPCSGRDLGLDGMFGVAIVSFVRSETSSFLSGIRSLKPI